MFAPKDNKWRKRGFKVADFCHRCRHLSPCAPSDNDPWCYRCGVPFITLTMARDSGVCKFFEDKSVDVGVMT